ncbi:peroxiredoxin family protein [Isoptericola sp. b441]|uniref:Peroxiredoxin family protein n=1 Tax=Actinotalea lenta TaxID=3064654 RepID=A0ABT9D9Q2_9CELL|nr:MULTISPECIES: peroxiredoxin family protein [unclassified Isoptericola]MDO8107611.1 peroxiredoxin family protein [Isoptericola sp. b441]MDO8120729.1 peroxiredoxin family protein [Isoptericola sp. b490]
MSSTSEARRREAQRQPPVAPLRAKAARGRRLGSLSIWLGVLLLVAAVTTAGLVTSRPASSDDHHAAPNFTLPTTAGTTVSLSDFRGRPVLLYFNEGAGCDACTAQLAAIEQDRAAFDDLGVAILPIVMNSRAQIQADLDRFGVTIPVLLDDGAVSKAYDTLGKGMHAGLPGHSFILIDAQGTQLWYGEYPSMWLAPADLRKEITSRLDA